MTTKTNKTAFNVFTKEWFENNPDKKVLPKGLWKEVSSDPAEKNRLQAIADRQNKEEGRVARKGTSTSRTVSGWNRFLKRLGELNEEKDLPKGSRLKSGDDTVKACTVRGADGKVDGDASITKLEAHFATL